MATRAAKPNTGPPVSGDDDGEPGEWRVPIGGELIEQPAEQTAADRVAEMLAGVSNDDRAKLVIHQVQINGKEAWCEDLSPGDYELGGLKMIRDRWGPGNYRVRLYGVRAGHFGVITSAQITLKESREPLKAPEANNDALRMMMQSQEAILRALTERPAAPDPKEAMRDMLSMLALMRDAFPSAPAPKQTGIAELVAQLREMREASDILMPDKGGEGESLTSMVKNMLPLVAQAMKDRKPGGPTSVGGPLVMPEGGIPPAGDLVQLGEGQQLTEGEDMGALQEALVATKLRAYVFQLLTWAGKAATLPPHVAEDYTEKAASLVADKLPDEWLEMLDLEDWWILFAEQVPQAVPHQAWFTLVRNRALVMLDEEGGETVSTVRDLTPPPPAATLVTTKAKKRA